MLQHHSSKNVRTNRWAINAITGLQYPSFLQAELAAKNFPSVLWLTPKQMFFLDVGVLPDQQGKAHECRMHRTDSVMTLYNSLQTTDPEKVQAWVGVYPRRALSNLSLPYSIAPALIKETIEKCHRSAHWINAFEVEALGVGLQPGAEPISVSTNSKRDAAPATEKALDELVALERDEFGMILDQPSPAVVDALQTRLYNVDHVVDKVLIERLRRLYPISVSSGMYYVTPRVVTQLLRRTVEENFTYPFWVTEYALAPTEIKIVDDRPAVVTYSELSGQPKTFQVYNAQQTSAPHVVCTMAYESRSRPLSAITGKPFDHRVSDRLRRAASQLGYKSVFWLTLDQMHSLGCTLKEAEAAHVGIISESSGECALYNAEQTTDPHRVVCAGRDKTSMILS
eukprot:PhM_4_TR15170/c0_g1_i1/m.58631